jgi:hypothetical protein
MAEILSGLANFIITPFMRWILLFLGMFVTTLQYINEPQRYSFAKAFSGLSYKWHLFLIAIITCVTFTLTLVGLWITIPFTDKLPDYWYMYIFILYLAIITQITVDTKQIKDDGSFNPPPPFMFPQKYRVLLTYAGLIIDIIIMIQLYIYFGIADVSKKTVLSRYFLERFGGWYSGNKLDFVFEWSGIIDVVLKLYILYLQTSFRACNYGLPDSWNA